MQTSSGVKRVSDLAYAARVAKSVVGNLTNVLATTTVKRTVRTAYNVVRATCWFCPITEGSKRPPTEPEPLVVLGRKPAPVAVADPDENATFNLMQRPL